MAFIAREIQLHITIGQFDGLRTAIYGMYQFCPAPHSVERESTGIAEHVQHTLSFGEALQHRTVLTLIHEESRLLAAQPVHIEFQTIFHSDIVVGTAKEEAVLHIVHKRQRGLTFVIDILEPSFHHVHQLCGNSLAAHVHADAMCLHHGSLAIDVDDESWQ